VGQEHPGVVDQDVQAAEIVGRTVDGGPYGERVGQVGLHPGMPAAGQRVERAPAFQRRAAVVHRDPVALRGERLRDCAADATRGTGDQGPHASDPCG